MNESSGNVQIIIKTVNNEDIVMRSTKQYAEKGEEIKTTEYFLDLEQANSADQVQEESEFITIEEHDPHFVSVEVANTEGVVLNDKEVIIWDELCRICANTNEQFIPIFSGEGLEHDLQSKIHSYLPLKISESDTLPNRICYNCAATLLSWHDLYKNCRSAQQRLVELQNKLNLKEQFYSEATTEEENVENVLEVETSNNDEFELSLKEEEQEEDNDDNDDDYDNAKEVQDVPEDSNRSASIQIARPITESLDTELAEKKPFSEYSADADTSVEPDDKDSPSPSKKKSKARKSNERTKITESRKKLAKEVNACSECGKLFKLKDSLKRHQRIHKDERPYTCYVCGKQFRDSGGLCRHLRDVHAKVKNHPCDKCGRSFASKSTLDDHLRTHTGERPFVCDSCGKRFKSKASLYTHSKTHTDEFPHVCVYCSKKFRRRQELLSHVLTHTGEKNYECDVCFKRFRMKTELKRHTLVHSDLKPFVCDVCGFSCRQKRYLTNHVRHKHDLPDNNNERSNV